MKSIEVEVLNKAGFHARPIQKIVEIISHHDCEVKIGVLESGVMVDAASMLNLMTLGATQGTKLLIEVESDDEPEEEDTLISELSALFHDGFGEEKN